MQAIDFVFHQCNLITPDMGRMRQECELKAEGDVMIMTVSLRQYQTVHFDNRAVSRFSSPNNEVCVLTRDNTERSDFSSFFSIRLFGVNAAVKMCIEVLMEVC